MNGSTLNLPNWQLPKIENILEYEDPKDNIVALDRERRSKIESALAAFNIRGEIVEILHGPKLTWFGFKFNPLHGQDGVLAKTRIKKINDLSIDIAIALAVPYVEVQTLIPGKDYTAIGVPNHEFLPITLRDVIDSENIARINSPLQFGLGVDVYGNPVFCGLTKLPHLLISGTINSGKSLCINAILISLLLNNTPDDLRLLLVDSKGVDMTNYNGIPHLLAPVIVEADKVYGALRWLSIEVDKRYDLISQVGASNIQDYNGLIKSLGGRKLPYILIVLDDVANVINIARDEIEQLITHLSQLGHVVGIHLVLATHRPSTDVISSAVKANFPARIAFSVTSSVDSRIILDQPGAEKLIGRGDMLFLTQESLKPLSIQGLYVGDSEQERLLSYWKNVSQK